MSEERNRPDDDPMQGSEGDGEEDPTRGGESGDDPTRGGESGADPTQGDEEDGQDPTQGDEGELPGEDPTETS